MRRKKIRRVERVKRREEKNIQQREERGFSPFPPLFLFTGTFCSVAREKKKEKRNKDTRKQENEDSFSLW